MSKKLVIDVAEFSKFLKDNPDFAKTVLDGNGDMVSGSPFEQYLIENPKRAEEIPGVSFQDTTKEYDELRKSSSPGQWMTQNEARALQLPTEDEVYEEALLQRASNVQGKLYRLNQDIRDEAESLAKKSEEAMRTKMELNVLLDELGPEVVGELDPNRKPNFTQGENLATRVQDASDRLKYTGPQILKAYAQLKAVFDIDNERPSLRDFTFSTADQLELSRYLSGLPKETPLELSYLSKLKNKQWPVDQLERRGIPTTERIETAKKHYRMYVEGKIKADG